MDKMPPYQLLEEFKMTTFTNSKKREILDIAAAKGAFFSVSFIKADGTVREMNCKQWMEKAFTNGSANAGVNTCAAKDNIYTVVDVAAENKKTLKELSAISTLKR